MKKKYIFLLLIGLVWIYPLSMLFRLEGAFEENMNTAGLVQGELRLYQASIWISWVVMVIIAIYQKWTSGKNFFFYLTYGFLLVGFLVLGYYTQRLVSVFELPSTFENDYTLGVFAAVQNIIASVILTGFLQAGVWWFTRRWHRR